MRQVSSAPVEWRWRKRSEAVAFASDHLASLQLFIGNLGSGTPQPVPRLRDRMLDSAPARKHKTLARCAYHVQRAQLLCKLRGKPVVILAPAKRVRVLHIR